MVGRERAQWLAHIRVNPRVVFHVADEAQQALCDSGTAAAGLKDEPGPDSEPR